MSKVIIFGVKDFASLAHYYLNNQTAYEVVGFTVNEDYMPDNKIFEGKPVISFEEIEKNNRYNPSKVKMFAPMSHSTLNKDREKIYNDGLNKGYDFISFVSPRCTFLINQIEDIGKNCFILEDNTIQPFVKIGNNCVFWSGNHIGHHSIIEDNVFFTSHVVLSGHCHVKQNAFFGVNATIRDGITIGEYSLIAMSAVVTKNTDPYGVYMGFPAKKKIK